MKFARRSSPTADGAPGTDAGEPAPPAPKPPPGAPVAAFAGVLDGDRLWLAVPARPGRLVLRETPSGVVRTLDNEVPDDQPGFLGARLDLRGLPRAEGARAGSETTYDVVLAPPGGRPAVAVWSTPLPPRPVPTTTDGHAQFRLRRTEGGHLQVRRTLLAPASALVAAEVRPDGLRLVLTGPASTLALLARTTP